jgi:hypothetical protein
MVADIKDFYLNTPLEGYEYMRLPLTQSPTKSANSTNLTTSPSPTMDGSTLKPARACTASKRLAS